MSVSTLQPLFKKELYEQYRTYRFFIALVIFLFLGISAPVITKLTLGHGLYR